MCASVIDGWTWVGSPFIRMSRDCKTTEMLDPAIGPGGRRFDTLTLISRSANTTLPWAINSR